MSEVNMDDRREFRRKRRAAGLSQTRLSQLSGVSGSMICLFEKGRRNAPPSTLKKLEQAIADQVRGHKMGSALRVEREEAVASFRKEIDLLRQIADAFKEVRLKYEDQIASIDDQRRVV